MASLAALYVSIVVAACAVVAVVAIDSAAADVVAGVIVVFALAVAARVMMRMAGDGGEAPDARRPIVRRQPR